MKHGRVGVDCVDMNEIFLFMKEKMMNKKLNFNTAQKLSVCAVVEYADIMSVYSH